MTTPTSPTAAVASTPATHASTLASGAPRFADGVMNFAGGWATVSERGPETMYVPKGATIWPHDAGGGGVTIQNLNVTQPFGTPAQIAAAIDAALMGRQLDIGTRY